MGKFCTQCGSELPEGSRFCTNCGNAVTEPTNVPAPEPVAEVAAPVEVPAPQPEVMEAPQAAVQPEAPVEAPVEAPAEANAAEPVVPLQFEQPVVQAEQPVVTAPVEGFTAEPENKKGKKKKKMWWMIPVAAVLALVVAAAFLWKPLLLKFAPDTYMSMAEANTMKDLEKRMEETPAGLIAQSFEDYKKNTTDISVDFKDKDDQQIKVDLSLAADMEKHQMAVNADFEVKTTEPMSVAISGDAGVFINDKFAAVGCDPITDGKYYGLTYDSFKEDIKKSAFAEMLTDEQIDQVADLLEQVSDQIGSDVDYEEILMPYVEICKDHIKTLDKTTGKESIELGDKSYKCDTISYEMDLDSLIELTEKILDQLEDDKTIQNLVAPVMVVADEDMDEAWSEWISEMRDSLKETDDAGDLNMKVTNYYRSMKLVAARMENEVTVELSADVDDDFAVAPISSDSESTEKVKIELFVSYGADPAKDDMKITFAVKQDDETNKVTVVSSVSKEDDICKETVKITMKGEDMDESIVLTSKWNSESGKWTIGVEGEDDGEDIAVSFDLKLKEVENGFKLSVDDVYGLVKGVMEDIGEEADLGEEFDCSISVTFTGDASIKAPEYINLDKIDETVVTEIGEKLEELGLGGAEGPAVPDDPSDEEYYFRLYDDADLLTVDERQLLDDKAFDLSYDYGMDVVLVTVESANGMSLDELADEYYTTNWHGQGSEESGVLLMLVMDTRDWYVYTKGEAMVVLPVDQIDDFMSDPLFYFQNDEYYDGFEEFLDDWDELASDYQNGGSVITPVPGGDSALVGMWGMNIYMPMDDLDTSGVVVDPSDLGMILTYTFYEDGTMSLGFDSDSVDTFCTNFTPVLKQSVINELAAENLTVKDFEDVIGMTIDEYVQATIDSLKVQFETSETGVYSVDGAGNLDIDGDVFSYTLVGDSLTLNSTDPELIDLFKESYNCDLPVTLSRMN